MLAAHAPALKLVGIEEGETAWSAALQAGGGCWVAIVVGASPFTRELHQFLLDFDRQTAEDSKDDIRLWVVAEDREIPSHIANICITVILEPPEGVRHKVVGTLSAWGRYEAEAPLVRVHACLALVHALAQERRAYIPHGWSRWYAWGWGEVQACARGARSVSGGGGARALATARALCGALYGARVAQEADARILRALVRNCLPQRALAHDWAPPAAPRPLPHHTRLQAYIHEFESWPELEPPRLLGLPANCRVAWENNAASGIIAGLREFNSTINVKKNDSVTPMKTLLALWKKLMSGNPLIKADYKMEKTCAGWWGCVCEGEARECAAAARRVHSALAAFASATQTNAHAHALTTVPEDWQLQWAGPVTPDAYLKELSVRAWAAIERLKTHPDDYMPPEVDLRSFARPQRVVWALRAHSARRLQRPPHQLALAAHWQPREGGSEVEGDAGLVVRGLRLSGAAWDGALRAAAPSAPPHCAAPPLLLRYVPSTEDPIPSSRSLELPVYGNEDRDELLFHVNAPLATDYDKDTATLNALALFIAPVD
ncbi:unnamed protein product, partial [Iphiclides podalirius]